MLFSSKSIDPDIKALFTPGDNTINTDSESESVYGGNESVDSEITEPLIIDDDDDCLDIVYCITCIIL